MYLPGLAVGGFESLPLSGVLFELLRSQSMKRFLIIYELQFFF